MARRLGTAPAGLEEALGCEEWDRSRSRIDEVLKAGASHAQLTAELNGSLRLAGWTTDVTDVRWTMGGLPSGFDAEAFGRAQRLHILLPQLKAAAEPLRELLGLAGDSESADRGATHPGDRNVCGGRSGSDSGDVYGRSLGPRC